MTDRRNARISSRKRPRQARSAGLVATILEAAIQVLASEGVKRFTTARVAKRAGVSVGSVYQYFPNKAAILFRLQSVEWRGQSRCCASSSRTRRNRRSSGSATWCTRSFARNVTRRDSLPMYPVRTSVGLCSRIPGYSRKPLRSGQARRDKAGNPNQIVTPSQRCGQLAGSSGLFGAGG